MFLIYVNQIHKFQLITLKEYEFEILERMWILWIKFTNFSLLHLIIYTI